MRSAAVCALLCLGSTCAAQCRAGKTIESTSVNGTCPSDAKCPKAAGGLPCCQITATTYECCSSAEACIVNVGCRCAEERATAQNHVKTVIATKDAPAAIGPYSQAILVRPPGKTEGGMAYVAGQIGLFPNGTVAPGGIKAEAQQAMSNIRAILKAASLVMDDIVECSCLLADLDEYADFNSVYATFFAEAPPARAAFQVVRLPKDVRCEVKCTALA